MEENKGRKDNGSKRRQIILTSIRSKSNISFSTVNHSLKQQNICLLHFENVHRYFPCFASIFGEIQNIQLKCMLLFIYPATLTLTLGSLYAITDRYHGQPGCKKPLDDFILIYDNYVGGWAVFSLDLFVLTRCLTKFFEKLCKDISLVLNQAIQEA